MLTNKSHIDSFFPGTLPNNKRDGSDRGQTSNLILESVNKDGHTLSELLLQTISQTGHHLSHARNGSLLHLLVNICCLQSPQSCLVDLHHKWLEIIRNGAFSYITRII